MVVIRPADANEVVEAYRLIFSLKNRPAALICSRQALPIFDRTRFGPANGLAKGGYVLADAPDGKPDVILIGCGSEVSLCVQASERLAAEGVKTRVVSMPAWELFDEQNQQYQDSVLPPSVTARVTVEEASPIGWERYAGRDGVVLGMRTFGMSAPMKVVAEHFGFTPDHVAVVAKEVLARCRERTTPNG
jgi:transketolase